MKKKTTIKLLGVVTLLMITGMVHAQGISTGIDAAAGQVKGVFSNVSNLVLMIGGVVGLVGGIRVYVRWQSGERDIQKEIVGWMGACVFLLLTGAALKTMFGM